MKLYHSKKLETVIYGITGMVFAAAFFFGIMYPEYEKDDHDIDIFASFPLSVSAERNVKIIGKPRRQGNMPSLPEIM